MSSLAQNESTKIDNIQRRTTVKEQTFSCDTRVSIDLDDY